MTSTLFTVAGIKTILRTHCPEPHGNPATLDAIGYYMSGLLSESTTMMVPSSVHPSFCDLKSWVDWEGPVRPHGMYFSWRSPCQVHNTSAYLFLGSWSSQQGRGKRSGALQPAQAEFKYRGLLVAV